MSTSSPSGEDVGEGPSTADAILQATMQVIGERGLKGATTRLIAQRAGVNEVTLFRKFGTKTNLIQAAIEQRFAMVRRSFGAYTGDIEADLTRLAEGYQAVLEGVGPAARVILTEISYFPDLARAIRGPQEIFSAVAELLARYQEDGVLRAEPPQTLVPAFVGPMMMPHIVKVVTDSTGMAPLEFDARRHVRAFLFGRATSVDELG